MVRWSSKLPSQLLRQASPLPFSGHQALHRHSLLIDRSWQCGRRNVISLAGVLDKAENVMPCYAIVQRQLGAQAVEEPSRNEETGRWAHSITWEWNDRKLLQEADGSSKKAAKNTAARQILRQLLAEEGEVMDPTKNAVLAEWAIQWLNHRLQATMEVVEEVPDENVGEEFSGDFDSEARHTCVWSCPQIPGETQVSGSGRTAAESRRGLMAELYKDLPTNLDDVIRSLEKEKRRRRGPTPEQANLGKINVLHNEACQQLGIRAQYTYGQSNTGGDFECTLTWSFYDEKQMGQRSEKVTATGKTKQVAKSFAHRQMLITQGHLPDLDEEFQREINLVKEALDEGLINDAVSKAIVIIEQRASDPLGWLFFLPEVLQAILAENDYGGLSAIMMAVQSRLHEAGAPIALWEALLDTASFSMRHFHLANSALQQIAALPLRSADFPGEREEQYFRKYRHLLALERHGGLLHGIQQYELDPHMFCSVPVVDVHSMEADKVTLTSLPEAGTHDIVEGARPLKGSDLVLLVPLEALDELRSQDAFEDQYQRSANWQHPEAWLASVTNVKGNPRFEEVRVHTRRISRFASDAQGGPDSETTTHLTSPIVPGRQYRLFMVAMETPTARMLSALRCLCRVQLPAWSDDFEGRRPSYQFSDGIRHLLLATPEEAVKDAPTSPRSALGVASPEEVMHTMIAHVPRFAALTPTQRTAVQRSMEETLSLIQGPPGTGKTHVACAIIAAWMERYGRLGERILAVADSNVAADNLYTRLELFGVEAVRVGQGKEVVSRSGDELWQAVKNSQVVIATCIGSGMDLLESKGTAKYFQRVIVDECTQACEPAAVVALGRSCEQVVLIGDHNQLPATVLSRVAQQEGLGISLFERMVLTNGLSPTVLIEQRRMHSSIAEFINKTFYQGQLVNAVDDSELAPIPGFQWPNPDCRVCFVDVSGNEQKRGYSAYNSTEAEAVAEVFSGLSEAGFPPQELCVLTAYLAQRDEIRRAIGDRYLPQANLSIDTIDGYQGMERDLVLFSAARSNAERRLGFLSDRRRMNVMLTRARRGLIVFGNADVLRLSMDAGSHWRDWLEWVESKGAIVSAADLFPGKFEPQTFAPAQSQTSMFPSNFSHGSEFPQGLNKSQEATDGSRGIGTNSTDTAPSTRADASVSSNAEPVAPAPALPSIQQPAWEKVYSEQYGRHYYWNTATNQTQWEVPPGMT